MVTSPADSVDVAVVGAGFGGLALASLCADAGLRVAVLERRPVLAPEGVGLVLQPNGLAVLDRLGLIASLGRIGERIDTARQCDASGRVRAEASYRDLDHPHPYFLVVSRAEAIALLAARLPDGAALRCGCNVTGVGEGTVRYTDAGGTAHTLDAKVVVGADGVGSVVRDAVGGRVRFRTGPDRFLIGFADVDAARFAGATLYCGRGWCDGVMPFRGGTYFFDHLVGESRAAVDRGDFDAWREAYARRVPEGERIASALGSFADVGFLSGRTHRVAPRAAAGVALLGDAAAAVHPHNGQGANLALEDAATLADTLLGDGDLRRYARERDAKSLRQVPWSIFIGRTFDGPHVGWRAVRRWGYVASRIPPIRRMTTQQQAGLG